MGAQTTVLPIISVQVFLICLFLSLELDYLLATRTAPCNSWRNPVERVMSAPNLGLQSVGMVRQAGDETFEATVSGCKNLQDLCKAAEKRPEF